MNPARSAARVSVLVAVASFAASASGQIGGRPAPAPKPGVPYEAPTREVQPPRPPTEQPRDAAADHAQHEERYVYCEMKTSKGTIVLELDHEKAPLSVDNFVTYAKDGHYNGTIFHRVISTFMIQGGGFTADMKQKPTRDPIKNEAGNGLPNVRGAVAMARTSVPDSATAQFFINVADNGFLDRASAQDGVGYAVFGKVVEGMDAVDAIKGVPTTRRNGMADVPAEAVVIESVRVLNAEEAAPYTKK